MKYIKVYALPKIKEIREEKGYTQREMASLLSVAVDKRITGNYLAQIEGRHKSISIEVALKISEYFQKTIYELFERADQ